MNATNGFKIGIKNLFSLTSANLISRVLGMIIVIYLANYLGPEGFGIINWGYSLYIFGTVVTDMGIQTYGIRTIAQSQENNDFWVTNFTAIRLVMTVIIFIMFSSVVLFTRSYPSNTVSLIYLCGLLITGWSLDWYFIGINKMSYVGTARIIQVSLYALSIILLFQSSKNVIMIPVAFLIGSLGANLFLMYVFFNRETIQLSSVNTHTWSGILRQSLPLGFSILIIQIYTNIPMQLLGYWSGKTELGEFSGAYRVVQGVIDLLGIFFVSIYPIAARQWIQNKAALARLLPYLLNFLLIITTPFIFCLSFLDANLLNLLLGERYITANFAFRILVWSISAVCFNGVFTQLVLIMGGHQMAYVKSVSIGAVISVILNLLFIYKLNAIGASIAYVITEVIVGITAYRISQKYIKINISGVWKTIAATALMFITAGIVNMLNGTNFVVVTSALLGYFIVIALSKTITLNDIKYLSAIIRN